MFNPLSILKMVVSPLVDIASGWQKRKTAKLDSDLKINEAQTTAQIKKINTGQHADIAWENKQIDQSGWKDDFWTIVIAIPLIMCFIPFMVQYVVKGFEALEKTPVWYQTLVSVAVASAFGVKKIIGFMKVKKGD